MIRLSFYRGLFVAAITAASLSNAITVTDADLDNDYDFSLS